MSVDLEVILGHSLDNSNILSLPQQLTFNKQIEQVMSRYYQKVLQQHFPLLVDDNIWYWEDSFNKRWEGTKPEEVWLNPLILEGWITNPIVLQGPCILSLHFGKNSLYLSVPLRLSTFVSDIEVQSETRQLCYALAQAVGSKEAIYLPDSGPWNVEQATDLVYETYSLGHIKGWLRFNIGAPATTINDIDTALNKYDGLGGYYIDTFSDLQTDSTS